MINKVINLSKDLIKIKSIEGLNDNLERILRLCLNYLKDYKIKPFEKNGIKSALIFNKPATKFKIIINSHLDIIPGRDNLFQPKIKDERIFGLGALDMKVASACSIIIFKELAKKLNYPIALQLVTDEEIGGFCGTKHQIEKGVKADFVIIGEPTNLDIEYEARGICWLDVECTGETAHGAYPWKGENAILKMNKFLNKIFKFYPLPKKEKWTTTINLSSIQTSNNVYNKIPDNCKIKLDIRYVPEEENIIKKIKKILPKDFILKEIIYEPPFKTNKNNFYLKKLKQISEKILNKPIKLKKGYGSSDLRHYYAYNIPGVEFGLSGKGMGENIEYVEIKSVKSYLSILKNFLLSLN